MRVAPVTFDVQWAPGAEFVPLRGEDGREYTLGPASFGEESLAVPALAGCYAFRIRSGTHEHPVPQPGITIGVVCTG